MRRRSVIHAGLTKLLGLLGVNQAAGAGESQMRR